MTYIQKLVSNDINRVTITGANGALIGYIEAEQMFGATASYSPLTGNDGNETIDKATQQFNSVVGTDIARTARPINTRVGWESSAVNGLSFSLYFLSYDGSNVMEEIAPVWDMVLPTTGGINSFIAPMDYMPNQKSKPKNFLEVKIGNWFFAEGFVMESALLTVSREKIDAAGTMPLYVKLDIALKPLQIFTSDVVASWFT